MDGMAEWMIWLNGWYGWMDGMAKWVVWLNGSYG